MMKFGTRHETWIIPAWSIWYTDSDGGTKQYHCRAYTDFEEVDATSRSERVVLASIGTRSC